MDILKAATDWAKSEVFSTPFFILFGIVFMAASFGFWQLGKTELARAYIVPTLIAGSLLTIIGLGLFFTNKSRLIEFEKAYSANPSAFVESEMTRVEKTIKEYRNIVFKAIPIIISICAFIILWVDKPIWRASMITTMAMLVVILLIDGTAHDRIISYKQKLLAVEKQISG